MKIALIGQDIPTLLPTLLTDLLFAGKARDAEIALEEKNPAMGAVLQGYGDAVFRQAGLGGSLRTDTDREAVLRDADALIPAWGTGSGSPADRVGFENSAIGRSSAAGIASLAAGARRAGAAAGAAHARRQQRARGAPPPGPSAAGRARGAPPHPPAPGCTRRARGRSN